MRILTISNKTLPRLTRLLYLQRIFTSTTLFQLGFQTINYLVLFHQNRSDLTTTLLLLQLHPLTKTVVQLTQLHDLLVIQRSHLFAIPALPLQSLLTLLHLTLKRFHLFLQCIDTTQLKLEIKVESHLVYTL